jgi:hypothetical protein
MFEKKKETVYGSREMDIGKFSHTHTHTHVQLEFTAQPTGVSEEELVRSSGKPQERQHCGGGCHRLFSVVLC